MVKIPSEIERLYKLGFAIHWLRPKSKIPVDSGWTSGPRADFEQLKARFKPSYNFGVRLGAASKVAGAYLAIIDVDVKSQEPKHAKEAHKRLFEIFPEVKHGPHLLSGRGNGSAHFYVRVSEPLKGDEVKARSVESVKVKMASVAPSKREAEELTDAEIAEGYRLRPAWEISLLCEGRQAAIVGSIHPDTGAPYRWGKPVNGSGKDIPILGPKIAISSALKVEKDRKHQPGPEKLPGFDLEDLEVQHLPLTDDQLAALRDGEGVSDRSAKVYELCIVLASAGVPDAKILSVMTDKSLYLGKCAFDHAKTQNRQRAARWVEKYCLRKAKAKVNETPYDIEEIPSDADLKANRQRHNESRPKVEPKVRVWPKGFSGTAEWENLVEVKPNGANKPVIVKCTLANISLILANRAPRPDFLRFDAFAMRILWTCDTPWGIKAGTERSSGIEDIVRIKEWFAHEYKIEPSNATLEEALMLIALRHEFHPVKDYLESLEWDGVERLAGAFRRYLGSEMPEPYLSEVSRKFFLGCVARIFEPGCKYDQVVVLEGKQGIGKSTFGNILTGDAWFMDGLPNFHDKDAALNLVGAWICELGELAAVYKSANESTKAFVTRRTDKIRPPFGKRWVMYHRSTVFLGSTDKRDYLTDSAGNRRFWPVEVKQCDFAAVKRDRDQLWAEAVYRYYFAPEKLFLADEALHQAKEVQELRRIEDEGDAMRNLFVSWLNDQTKDGVKIETLKMSELFDERPWCVLRNNRGNTMRGGDILREFNYEKCHTKTGNVWRRKRVFTDKSDEKSKTAKR